MVEDDRIHLIKLEQNIGQGLARNKAIEKAKGKYIAFLDSDDIWAPQKLEFQVNHMLNTDAPFSHTAYGYINEEGDRIKSTFHLSKKNIGYRDLLKRNEIGCLTAMYDVEKIGKMYMPDLRKKRNSNQSE